MSFDPISAAFDLGKTLIGTIWPDPAKQADAQYKLAELAQKGDLAELNAYVTQLSGQLSINAKEAEHKSVFVAGWRPFVGWVGGLSLAYVSMIEPLMRFIASMAGYGGEFPVIDTTLNMQVLLGMLGIGGMRSLDKYNGTSTNDIKSKKDKVK